MRLFARELRGARELLPGPLQLVGPARYVAPTRARRERLLGERLVAAAEDAGCDVTLGVRHLPRVDVYWPHDGAYRAALTAKELARARKHPRRQPGGGEALAARTTPLRGRHRVFLDFERRLLEQGGARRIVCVSELVRRELATLYPACAQRLVVVPNGVDLERFHPDRRQQQGRTLRRSLGLAADEPLLVWAGRDPLRKGLPELLRALAASAALRARRWSLLIAGPRHPRTWQRVAQRAGLAQRQVLVRAELDPVALFAAADVTVVPTWRDTSLLVLLESMASGTPVVTTRHAGAAEYVLEGVSGSVLAEPDDAEALGQALDAWLERCAHGSVDREAIRACVAALGEAAWLGRLEREVLR